MTGSNVSTGEAAVTSMKINLNAVVSKVLRETTVKKVKAFECDWLSVAMNGISIWFFAILIISNYWLRLSTIVRIIVGWCIICRSRGLRRTTQPEALIMLAIMKKLNSVIVLLSGL